MIRRVRSQLVGFAVLASLVSAAIASAVMRSQEASDLLPVAAGAFVIASGAGLMVAAVLGGALRELIKRTREVVRDPGRRIPSS